MVRDLRSAGRGASDIICCGIRTPAPSKHSVANADEPWTEALFEDAAEGKLTLIVSPLRRLISKNNATIRDVGPPETVLGSVGAFITGTSPPDDEDVVRFLLISRLARLACSLKRQG